ncbi:MAG: kinase/pyrophosphorylase [Legionellaceae bacterium]|nr:kinase/pyrophosphorylase [Legionellaceae bacterium]
MKRTVFMISDGTAITVESLCSSLLTQFDNIEFSTQIFPFVDTMEKAESICSKIELDFENNDTKPLVFMTLVDPNRADLIKNTNACVFDLFESFLSQIEQELGVSASDTVGRAHSVSSSEKYDLRIDAVNYALAFDDGIKISGYEKADIILIGVSRCGKTPSCLYMALQFGVFAANYPFTDDNLTNYKLPETLIPFKHKLFGLTIDAQRLCNIRMERRPNTRYSSLAQCRREVSDVELMYKNERIPYINSTSFSIEEISTKIMSVVQISRKI